MSISRRKHGIYLAFEMTFAQSVFVALDTVDPTVSHEQRYQYSVVLSASRANRCSPKLQFFRLPNDLDDPSFIIHIYALWLTFSGRK